MVTTAGNRNGGSEVRQFDYRLSGAMLNFTPTAELEVPFFKLKVREESRAR
jgi:hypothetical protein